MYWQLDEVRLRKTELKQKRRLFISMTAMKHQVWFSIKSASALVLQPCDYNRPEGAGC